MDTETTLKFVYGPGDGRLKEICYALNCPEITADVGENCTVLDNFD